MSIVYQQCASKRYRENMHRRASFFLFSRELFMKESHRRYADAIHESIFNKFYECHFRLVMQEFFNKFNKEKNYKKKIIIFFKLKKTLYFIKWELNHRDHGSFVGWNRTQNQLLHEKYHRPWRLLKFVTICRHSRYTCLSTQMSFNSRFHRKFSTQITNNLSGNKITNSITKTWRRIA